MRACRLSLRSCSTLCDPLDCRPPGCPVHEILPARILEWVAMLSFRRSSRPRKTCISWTACIKGGFFTPEPLGKPELPYDPAIPLLGMYLKNILIWKDTYTPVFIAALFTITKTWKQPKCSLTDEHCGVHIHTHIHTHTSQNTTEP